MKVLRVWLLVLLVGWGGVLSGATIRERSIDARLMENEMRETLRLVVSIEETGDLEAWSEYPIFVDDHIELTSVLIRVVDASGKTVDTLKRRDLREETSVGFGLHSSTKALVADLPRLSIGDTVFIERGRRHVPLFRDDWEPILLETPQERLSIRLSGGGDHFRWKLRNADDLVEVREDGGVLTCTGTDLPRRTSPDQAGDVLSVAPVLMWSWDAAQTWDEVGAWYSDLSQGAAARAGPRVKELAARLTSGIESTRDQLLALADYARLKVRYEAVEIGVGGWIPSTAEAVIERGWGDCKDKSLLLKNLAEAIGLKAHLVLIHNGRTLQVDPNFPSTLGINHCVVAVETEGLDPEPTDPVVDGLFFFDPTFDRGAAAWLNPTIQGQWSIVATPGGGRLVKLPVRFGQEIRALRVDGVVDAAGALQGAARLTLVGDRAVRWLRNLDSASPDRIEEDARSYFRYLLPGMTFGRVVWRRNPGDAPSLTIEGSLSHDRFVRMGRSRRVRTAFLDTLPETRELEDRSEPIVIVPGINLTQWVLTVPSDWCPLPSEPERVANSIGTIEQGVDVGADGAVTITRETVVRRSWIGVESLEHLEELATAENRLGRGSLRTRCPEAP